MECFWTNCCPLVHFTKINKCHQLFHSDGSGTNFERKSPSEEDDSSNDEVKPKQRSARNKTDVMKEELDEEVQGEVEPNQEGWSLVIKINVIMLFCDKNLEKNSMTKG